MILFFGAFQINYLNILTLKYLKFFPLKPVLSKLQAIYIRLASDVRSKQNKSLITVYDRERCNLIAKF